MFGVSDAVLIVAGCLVLVLIFVMATIAKMYRKVGPHEALLITGGAKCASSKAAVP